MAHQTRNLGPLECRRKQFNQRKSSTSIVAKRPQGISKTSTQRHLRRSARLQRTISEHTQSNVSHTEKKILRSRNRPTPPQSQGRKRPREAENLSVDVAIASSVKRRRTSADFTTRKPTPRKPQIGRNEALVDPVAFWLEKKKWPKEYFESDAMNHLLARRKSAPSLRRKRSDSGSLAASSTTPSDQKPREEKSAPYRDTRYETLLETKSSFMSDDRQGPKNESKDLCQGLLAKDQDVPSISRFSENVFRLTCQRLQKRNEAKVIQDITRLIVPSAEELADFGAEHLECLVEAVNEGWNNSIPLTGSRPQPDYSVGFERTAFSEEQREKLAPFVGDFIAGDQSFFMATYYMYFPFLTCEVKCGAAALDIADRQNAHSITLAVRAVVELFRLVKREREIHREILAFSISHDHRSVRIYGHYAVIDGPKTTFYRHPIRTFDFTELNGREKWTTYKFTKSIYDSWMPAHFQRICSAIDDLPRELDFDAPPLPQDSGLSQDLVSHHASRSFVESMSQGRGDHSDIGDTTPNTSFTQKRPRRRGKK